MTVVLISHSMEDVAQYVSRIVVMNHGEVAFDAKPQEVFQHYQELEEMGLAAPQVTYALYGLKKMGLDVDTNLITLEDAADNIAAELVKEKEGKKAQEKNKVPDEPHDAEKVGRREGEDGL